ncbi:MULTISPECIES: KdsC family phosphatase [Neisseria]|uniref:3-deoxy-D-manno-octulosonate 8-phosphate phosphatase KdsC n=1 Tax=Neisseria dumasiana TaxID=1931275 RepID=A0A1X3D5D2_9NEIS|nr:MULTISPECIES: HAD family hydrolase [Neisseria]KPN72916.1 3-deoxy-D-manno-octulosonate 8-phosphate phosphatase [Neisseria sp. 74A18]OSI15120.1 phenylphosphate carboxylase subunit delta [Neisseria dumasiana]OSI16413.1 phenylphosphate carboxylase subunit delta [Neisseria dumasiana]OSI32624.1 phenylphosphate carboxylase subunit delta [Neisseria dumasiana]UOO84705.1 HAD family hydrolase [Neisseria dumasiana]
MHNLTPEIQARAAKIKLLIMDVDGVLTDGRIFIRDNGEEIKSFHTLDGHGLKMLQAGGVQTAIITGRDAPSVGVRVQQLGINHYYKGIHDKRAAYADLREKAGVEEHECAFIGDDVVDLPVMVRCGLPVAVPEAHWFTLQHAAYVTRKSAGNGAVRELCDLIMQAQGTLEAALQEYVK